MKKKLVAALMAAVMATTMCACTGEKNDKSAEQNETTEKSKTDATNSETSESEGKVDIWEPYDETVTLHTVTSEMASAVYPEGDDVTNNVWTREYKSRFNVEVITDWVSDEYDTKLNLSIAEGDLPDVFHVNESQLQQLVDADLIWDLSDIYEKYASDVVKNNINGDPDCLEAGKRNGKLYGIPQMHYGPMEQPDYVWIRKDWREALNLEEPETMDDLVNIMKAFMEKYGCYGMAAEQTLDHLNLLAPAWGAHPDAWIKTDDGKIEYGSVQPEMKEALEEWAKWYQEGILSPDFAMMDMDKMNQDVIAGKVGVQPFYQWWGWNPGKDVVSGMGQDSYFEPFQIPSANGEEVLQTLTFSNTSYTVVSKKCKNPEAALKLINLYCYIVDDSAGKEDQEWIDSFTMNDMAHVVGAFRVLNPNSGEEDYDMTVEALEKKDPSGITSVGAMQRYNDNIEWEKNHTPSTLGSVLQMSLGRCSYGIAKDIIDNKKYIKSELKGITPETIVNSGSTLDDILTEGFTKIIIGDQPIEYFDTVVENWKAAGGEQATSEMNEIYNQ